MTIDNRRDYLNACKRCGIIHSEDYRKRYNQGCTLKHNLKTYWHLIDQRKHAQ